MTTIYDELFLEGCREHQLPRRKTRKTKRQLEREARQRIADHIDGYDRDDLGESPDY